MDEQEQFFEIPVPKPTEFRLYYDDNGNVICYTTENLEGNFIVITPEIFAQCRHDIKVINGKLQEKISGMVLSMLELSTTGVRTSSEDISIVVSDDYKGTTNTWELKHYEL